jgi:hypothetical protein
MAPRANFVCQTCVEDFELPVTAKQCPICAGQIDRLFDQVNVATGLAVTKAVEKMERPHREAKDTILGNRSAAESRERELKDRVEQAMPEVNRQLEKGGMSRIGASQAIGMVDQAGRMASRYATSMLFGRKVTHTKIRE